MMGLGSESLAGDTEMTLARDHLAGAVLDLRERTEGNQLVDDLLREEEADEADDRSQDEDDELHCNTGDECEHFYLLNRGSLKSMFFSREKKAKAHVGSSLNYLQPKMSAISRVRLILAIF